MSAEIYEIEIYNQVCSLILIRHYPYYPFSIGKKYDGRLSDHTMVIRVYGVDCPEIGERGEWKIYLCLLYSLYLVY
jgi:hypothetical protein